VKQSITLRIDADVLAVLKGYGKGYQAKGNNSLNKAKILFFLIIDGICVYYGL